MESSRSGLQIAREVSAPAADQLNIWSRRIRMMPNNIQMQPMHAVGTKELPALCRSLISVKAAIAKLEALQWLQFE